MAQPVVIDNGSGTIKAGFAGEEQPKTVFASYIGIPKHQPVMAGAPKDDHFVGSKISEMRGLMKLKWPMERGVVTDWKVMEQIWNQVYDELGVKAEEHPVLLTEAPLNPRKNRERMAQIFFETFNVPSLYVSLQAVLSLYASGRTTGLVLDAGDGCSHIVPIYQGFALNHGIVRNDIGGRDVTEQLQLGLRRSGYTFHTSAEKEIVRDIKEKLAYVAFDPLREEDVISKSKDPKKRPTEEYLLPDGQKIDVGMERFRAPEVLFNPELMGSEYDGLSQSLIYSVRRCDVDLRANLYSNIVLSGGSTLFPGFGERLLSEVKKLAPPDVKIKILAPSGRQLAPWLGGSILASLGSFANICVSHDEWKNDGPNILHRKTF